MSRIKNLLGLLAAILFVSLTAACGGGSSVTSPSDPATPAPVAQKMTVTRTVTVNGAVVQPVSVQGDTSYYDVPADKAGTITTNVIIPLGHTVTGKITESDGSIDWSPGRIAANSNWNAEHFHPGDTFFSTAELTESGSDLSSPNSVKLTIILRFS